MYHVNILRILIIRAKESILEYFTDLHTRSIVDVFLILLFILTYLKILSVHFLVFFCLISR